MDRPAAPYLRPIAGQPRPGDPTRSAGHAAMALIQRAAELAKSAEERAEKIAEQAIAELQDARNEIRTLEAKLLDAEARAREAEKWILRIHQSIEEQFFLPTQASARPVRRSAA